MKTAALALLAALLALADVPVARADIEADVEAGVAAASRNDTRIPSDTGTTLSLVDELSTPVAPAFRLRLGYRHGRHLVSALYAPLQVNATGSVDRDVNFEGTVFPAGTPLLAVYRFNSYRLTYRYTILERPGLELGVGATAKIRDAETSLYGGAVSRKTNVGFVPLLNLHLAWRPHGGRLGFVVDADALAAPQGRAEDVLLAVTWRHRPDLELRAGYRTVEGGADVAAVYSFAWIHYAVAGVWMSF